MSLLNRKTAVDLAMEARRRPELVSLMSAAPLPRDVKILLRIAADGASLEAKTQRVYRGHSPDAVREACIAFLSVILFSRRSDPYRVLGLQPGASEDQVRDHKRLLLKWLHPDRNPSQTAGVRQRELLSRVLDAAAEIEGKRPVGTEAVKPPPIPAHPSRARHTAPRPSSSPLETVGARLNARLFVKTWHRSIKLKLARALAFSFQSLRRASYAVAALLAALIIWRYVMQEPIGLSLQRYSQAAMGFISW